MMVEDRLNCRLTHAEQVLFGWGCPVVALTQGAQGVLLDAALARKGYIALFVSSGVQHVTKLAVFGKNSIPVLAPLFKK